MSILLITSRAACTSRACSATSDGSPRSNSANNTATTCGTSLTWSETSSMGATDRASGSVGDVSSTSITGGSGTAMRSSYAWDSHGSSSSMYYGETMTSSSTMTYANGQAARLVATTNGSRWQTIGAEPQGV